MPANVGQCACLNITALRVSCQLKQLSAGQLPPEVRAAPHVAMARYSWPLHFGQCGRFPAASAPIFARQRFSLHETHRMTGLYILPFGETVEIFAASRKRTPGRPEPSVGSATRGFAYSNGHAPALPSLPMYAPVPIQACIHKTF